MGAPEAPGTLASLADLLERAAAPPRLGWMIASFSDVEALAEFHRMVEDLLPQDRPEILSAGTVEEMMAAFAKAFQRHYFPLLPAVETGYFDLSDLLAFIPIAVRGWDYDEYHELPDMRESLVLSALLVDFEETLGWEEEGIRITAQEAITQVPREALARAPEQGYPLAFLQEVLPGTPYQGLLDTALFLCHETGSYFLDATEEELGSDPPDWCRECIEGLTHDWALAQEIDSRMVSFWEWLEISPAERYAEVLAFLGRRWRSWSKPKRRQAV